MNILNIIKLIVSLSPEVIQLIESILAAFTALPQEHQQNIQNNITAVAQKYKK